MRYFVFIFFIFASIANVFAPTLNFYRETKTFYEEGYTYQCDVPPYKIVTLYNKENKFTYQDILYKNTGKLFDPPVESNFKTILHNVEMDKKPTK